MKGSPVPETPDSAQLDGDSILARPVRTRVRKFRGKTLVAGPSAGYELDEVGALILSKINGRTNIADIGLAIAEEYDISAGEATADVIELLQPLADNGLLKVVTG